MGGGGAGSVRSRRSACARARRVRTRQAAAAAMTPQSQPKPAVKPCKERSTCASASTRSRGRNDDLPSLGGETPLETALAEGKAIGYEGFELGNKFPREPQALRAVLGAPRPRAACRAGTRAGSRAGRSTRRSRRSVRISNCSPTTARKVMVYGEVADCDPGRAAGRCTSGRASTTDAEWSRIRRARHGVRAAHARPGVRLAYHHHMGAYVETPEDVDQLMQGHRRRGRPAVRHAAT